MTRIGIITQHWLPAFGGAERHTHDLAATLLDQGFDVRVLCSTAAVEGRDNGRVPVTRWRAPPLVLQSLDKADAAKRTEAAATHAFIDEACRWAEANGIEIAILGNPLQRVSARPQARELVLRLKARGVRVGLMHFDTPLWIGTAVVRAYLAAGRDWDAAARIVMDDAARMLRQTNRTQLAFLFGSPLFFAPDFVITCSAWVARLVDPLGETPAFVFHPPLDAAHWSTSDPLAEPLARRDVLMVNPQGRKGPGHMAALIAEAEPTWTFRVLAGGWGGGLPKFQAAVAATAAVREGRVEFLDYVPDMRAAYRAAGLVFFPSLAEGYGLTAVEPMLCGTPVVASSLPAVREAVGDAARIVCPYSAPAQDWRAAVGEVLAEPEPWQARGFTRARQLEDRRLAEASALADVMRSLA
jgi:glycosyltransferase involved in cell wall biosynthesis